MLAGAKTQSVDPGMTNMLLTRDIENVYYRVL